MNDTVHQSSLDLNTDHGIAVGVASRTAVCEDCGNIEAIEQISRHPEEQDGQIAFRVLCSSCLDEYVVWA